MRSHKFGAGALALLLASASSGVADGQSGKPRYGKPISEGDIAAWNIDVRTPDGKNLPSGKGSVAEGKVLFAAQCAACHGDDAKEHVSLRADPVRLGPADHADDRSAEPDQRSGLRAGGQPPEPERPGPGH